jgi:diphthamide biosynthesis protein 4
VGAFGRGIGVELEVSSDDHYAALGVPPTATLAEIRAAYHAAARATHPDAARGGVGGGGAPPPAAFHAVQRAWETLQHAILRARYDEDLASAAAGAAAASAAAVPVSEDVRCDTLLRTAGGALQHPCRCGAAFLLASGDVAARAELVQCSGCSLFIRVLW